ncbi:transposase [Mesorhizobium sp. M1380]|uniref:IS4/Tn5 family transposase DNA-binding protein n=1 Tax=Mesorhizobium sp. M1380 TaxID=2957093 RepID=UPI00333873F6
MLDQMSGAPGKPIPATCGDWAAAKAAYRFFENPRVTALLSALIWCVDSKFSHWGQSESTGELPAMVAMVEPGTAILLPTRPNMIPLERAVTEIRSPVVGIKNLRDLLAGPHLVASHL